VDFVDFFSYLDAFLTLPVKCLGGCLSTPALLSLSFESCRVCTCVVCSMRKDVRKRVMGLKLLIALETL
jgi:hypothetical protein